MPIYALGSHEPSIDPTAYIHPDAVVIGEVTIGPESSVWPSAVLRGDPGGIVIGARTSIQDGTVVHTTPLTPTLVGDECVIGHLVHLEGCTIGNGSLVGSGAIVLNGAVVEDEALVGAGALVPGNLTVPSRAMALGVPATLKLNAVHPELHIQMGMHVYVERGRTYREELRRLD
jgi:carbonic anhydrase/acetyltransferase-like protein (isoleucine patch superfamily)